MKTLNPFFLYRENPSEENLSILIEAREYLTILFTEGVAFSDIQNKFNEKFGYYLDFSFLGMSLALLSKRSGITPELYALDNLNLLIQHEDGSYGMHPEWCETLKNIASHQNVTGNVSYSFSKSGNESGGESGSESESEVVNSVSTKTFLLLTIGVALILIVIAKTTIAYMEAKQKVSGKDHVYINTHEEIEHKNDDNIILHSVYEYSFYLNSLYILLLTCIPSYIIFLYVYKYYYYYRILSLLRHLKNILNKKI